MSSSSEDEVPTKEEKVSIDEEEESVEEEEVSTEKEEVTTEKQKVSTEKEEDPRDLWIPKGIIMTDAFQKYCMHFFGKSEAQRTAELYDQCDRCMGGLDNIPEDWRQSDHERAMYAYFQGKMLAALPVYKKEAETFLWEAIHLDSDIWDAWRCLCNCFIKKGDLIRARNCANFPLNRKGPEKESLCQLSYILRMLAQDDEKPLELIDKSIKKAHEAINLDENDGFSWYTLGGAYLAYFFQTGECEFNQLLLSLTAYEMAMKDRIWQTYPNLVYDIAVVNTLLENYETALATFKSNVLSSNALYHSATENIDKMIRLLDKLFELLKDKSNNKGKGKGKAKSKGKSNLKTGGTSVASLESSFANLYLSPLYELATMDILAKGFNKGISVIAEVLHKVKNEKQYPLYYVLCDTNLKRFVVTVHGISDEAIKQRDQVTLLEPYCKFVDFKWEEKHYKFKAVRVNRLDQILVNGNALLRPELLLHQPLRIKPKA